LIDDLLDVHDANGQPLSEKTIQVQAMTPLMVGVDTGTAAAGFLLRSLLHHPDALAQVQAETDRLFADGIPAYDNFRTAEKIHAAFIETLRLYPISPFVARRAASTFQFADYEIPAGADVMVGNGVTHYLPEFFEQPEQFRLDRPRPEQYTYMPFGAGTHVCMGSGVADIIIATAVATLLHEYEIEFVNGSRSVFINPVPNPGRDFAIRLHERKL
jgi:cytochrome P450